MLVRIVDFKRGNEGRGFTHFAIKRMSDETFMDLNGQFGLHSIHDPNVLGFNTDYDAKQHIDANPDWVLEAIE